MGADIGMIEQRLDAATTLGAQVDLLFEAMHGFGFDALIYDYTPARFDLDGAQMMPSVLELRNVDESMRDYWFGQGYFRLDPVQKVALGTTRPFVWNYDARAETLIRAFMNEDSAPVADFLAARGMSAGVTVPVHMPGGDYATITGIRCGDRGFAEREAKQCLGEFGLLAHLFQHAAHGALREDRRLDGIPRLTARERECLRHAAEGLSAKEISRALGRSVPTVVMHLNAAMRKLQAKNRTQAAVRAARLRLLD
ncbi:helix-turn-helix transcriptional regulator [Ancylobacter vacuolatus]|uniref:LuxR family transcriptional regulator n=1 Tax=Ancylobacter vacuolatus TaxID=223389 RepID=A0ABU0DCG8_9HYPH|nr:LuxR family transcriptional regulator [Ancylobacter vacuolatus]MDQ0346094.1 LuxR family transcriptional regulator [Ancylobacter vacuolatus]